MSAALSGFALVLIVAIAADYRVLNALICLFKSLTRKVAGLTPAMDAKGNQND